MAEQNLYRAVQAVLREADARANSKHPLAYICPWGPLTRLRKALEKSMNNDEPVPGFCLTPHDCAQLTDLLAHYGPYENGQTAVFWHIVGIIGSARKQLDPEEELKP